MGNQCHPWAESQIGEFLPTLSFFSFLPPNLLLKWLLNYMKQLLKFTISLQSTGKLF